MQGYSETTTSRQYSSDVLRRWIVIAFIAVALSGCSLLQKFGILSEPEVMPSLPLSQQPYDLKLRLSTSNDVNPDAQSRPSSVEIRVFVIEPMTEAKDISFEEMFDYAGNLMEPRPLSTLILRPGQTKDILLSAMKSQSTLVVAAAFRDPYQSLWKAIATLNTAQSGDTFAATATIGANTVAITTTP